MYPPATMPVRRKRPPRTVLAGLVAFVFAWGLRTEAAEPFLRVERLAVSRGLIVAVSRLDAAFDADTRSSIERGLPITVRYTVDLWRDRRNWMDKQIDSRVRSFRLRFHPGERLYSVTEGERPDRRQTFETLDQVIEEVSARVLAVHPRWELEEDRPYFVTLEAAIQPLTWSEFQELDGWISGRIRGEGTPEPASPEEDRRGVSRALFEFLVDLSGFGDTYIRARTASFRPGDLPPL